jgi:hypothetical protein
MTKTPPASPPFLLYQSEDGIALKASLQLRGLKSAIQKKARALQILHCPQALHRPSYTSWLFEA